MDESVSVSDFMRADFLF